MTFSNKQQLIEFTDSRLALQEMLTVSLGQKECLTVTPRRWESWDVETCKATGTKKIWEDLLPVSFPEERRAGASQPGQMARAVQGQWRWAEERAQALGLGLTHCELPAGTSGASNQVFSSLSFWLFPRCGAKREERSGAWKLEIAQHQKWRLTLYYMDMMTERKSVNKEMWATRNGKNGG